MGGQMSIVGAKSGPMGLRMGLALRMGQWIWRMERPFVQEASRWRVAETLA